MGQPGFCDLQRRYEGLDAKSDPLAAILAAVPFEQFRGKLKTAPVGIAPMNRDSGQWRGQAHNAASGVWADSACRAAKRSRTSSSSAA